MKTSVDFNFNTANYNVSTIGINPYSGSNIMLGSAFYITTGSPTYVSADKFIYYKSPYLRFDDSILRVYQNPIVVEWSDRYNWIFLVYSNPSASPADPGVLLIEHDKINNIFNQKGSIAFSVGLRSAVTYANMLYYKHIDGTVGISGNNLLGNGTDFVNAKVSEGSRIGFGSRIPSQVAVWSEVQRINNASGITLTTNLGTLNSGTQYVIEDLWCFVKSDSTNTIAATYKLLKGLSYNLFSGGQLVQWDTVANSNRLDGLRDNYTIQGFYPTHLNRGTSGVGVAFETYDKVTSGSHYFYIIESDFPGPHCFKMNIRANLSGPTTNMSGSTTNACYVAETNRFAITTLTSINFVSGSQRYSNLAIAPYGATGSLSLFFVGSAIASYGRNTAVFRADLNNITSGSPVWMSDYAIELPPLGGQLIPLSYNMGGITYMPGINRFITPYNVTPWGACIFKYDARGIIADNYILPHRSTQSLSGPWSILASSGSYSKIFSMPSGAYGFSATKDYLYIIQAANIGLLDQHYTMVTQNYLCDWNYTDSTQQYVITPKIPTPYASKLYHAYFLDENQVDTESTTDGVPPEPYEVDVRTSGMDDDAGGWITIDDASDLSGVQPGNYIQFRLSFRVFGPSMRISKIYGITLTYEQEVNDTHYEFSSSKSSSQQCIFAWRQTAAWGTNIPNLKIKFYKYNETESDELIFSDTTALSEYGVWQYSTDGVTWNAWSSSADNAGNYIRYISYGLPNNLTVKAVLVQA
jgi:hypothetical protein